MNDNLERMWKEAAMVYFKILSQRSPRGSEEIHKKKKNPSVSTAGL
jgi:hypothetical protein